MNQLNRLAAKAQHSSFYLWALNFISARFVPFNKPHSFSIKHITGRSVLIELPYKKGNLNHVKGIHACALATLCEYATGITLLLSVNPSLYRILLKSIHLTYHYQAKTAVRSTFELSPEWVEHNITGPLRNTEAVFAGFKIEVYDTQNNHICTGLINWQIKSWKNVKTK